VRKEFQIKGDCNVCAQKKHCPRMKGQNICYGKKERVSIDVDLQKYHTQVPTAFRPRILIIDDRDQIADLLKINLEDHDQQLAQSGPEGIERFKDNPVDLIICDLAMSGTNGWEVGKAIKEFCDKSGTLKPPIIILAAWDHQGHDKRKISESGVDTVLLKPVDMMKLLEVIRGVMENSRRKSSRDFPVTFVEPTRTRESS
jgi:DNA-binding response OmpR family regulator